MVDHTPTQKQGQATFKDHEVIKGHTPFFSRGHLTTVMIPRTPRSCDYSAVGHISINLSWIDAHYGKYCFNGIQSEYGEYETLGPPITK
jgi:hypothetical protein